MIFKHAKTIDFHHFIFFLDRSHHVEATQKNSWFYRIPKLFFYEINKNQHINHFKKTKIYWKTFFTRAPHTHCRWQRVSVNSGGLPALTSGFSPPAKPPATRLAPTCSGGRRTSIYGAKRTARVTRRARRRLWRPRQSGYDVLDTTSR